MLGLCSIHDVTVVAVTGSGAAVCSTSGVTTSIEFVYEFGDLPLMTSDRTSLVDSTNTQAFQFNWGFATISESYKGVLGYGVCNISGESGLLVCLGTKIDFECSRQGYCNVDLGRCECLAGYQSSSGDVFVPGER